MESETVIKPATYDLSSEHLLLKQTIYTTIWVLKDDSSSSPYDLSKQAQLTSPNMTPIKRLDPQTYISTSYHSRTTTVERNLCSLVTLPPAAEVLCRMPEAEYRNCRQHGHRFENIKHPLMREWIPEDAKRKLDQPIDRTNLLTSISFRSATFYIWYLR